MRTNSKEKSKKLIIGIIGYGVVGKAIDNTLSSEFKMILFDKYVEHNDFTDLSKCDFIFISVPTPFDCIKNSVDDSAVRESLGNLSELNYQGIVIIKSTIPPGSCDKYKSEYSLKIVFNPEFLRESTSPNEDFKNQDCIVIGTESDDYYNSLKDMYSRVSVVHAQFYKVSCKEAEMIKYCQNTMLASRVALANMIYDACEINKVNYEIIKRISFDNFEILGPHMVQVPGPDGERGFGGKCLPKDIRGFSTIHNSPLIQEIIRYNDSLRDDLSNFLTNYKK